MKKLKVPAAQDIARMDSSTIEEVEKKLFEYYSNGGGLFNYGRSERLTPHALSRNVQLKMLLNACDQERTKQGRNQNREVLNLIWKAGEKRQVVARELSPKLFPIRNDLLIKVKPTCLIVEGGNASVFWLQPRQRFALTDKQLGLLASIVKLTYLVDDYEGVGFEVLDLRLEGTERASRTSTLNSLPLVTIDEVRESLQRFAIAYDRVCAKGVKQKIRPTKRPSTGPDLFNE